MQYISSIVFLFENFDIPFQLLHNQMPFYDHIQTFGCLCYPNLSSTAPHKLAPRSSPCIFLGFLHGYKGYRCYNPATGKVIMSRHVTFHEDIFPAETSLPVSSTSSNQSFTIGSFTNPAVVIPSLPLPTAPHITTNTSDPGPSTEPLTQPTIQLPAPPPSQPEPAPPSTNIHPMRTRAKDGITKPRTILSLTTVSVPQEPHTYTEAAKSHEWRMAMFDEYNAILQNKTWDLVPAVSDKKIFGCKWVYRIKQNVDFSFQIKVFFERTRVSRVTRAGVS